jgi:hypothetical protein
MSALVGGSFYGNGKTVLGFYSISGSNSAEKLEVGKLGCVTDRCGMCEGKLETN